jgi:ribosomal protein S27E
VRGAVGLATDVTCVIVGTPVITLTGGAVVFDARIVARAMFTIWMA